MFQTVLAGGPSARRGQRHPPQVDCRPDADDLADLDRRPDDQPGRAGQRPPGRGGNSPAGATRDDTVDYLICTDRSGARLVLPRGAARGPVYQALAYQRKHHLTPAKVSRFAAMGAQELEPNNLRFRTVRTLLLIAGLVAYTAIVCWLMVEGIPALAPGR